MAKTLDRLEGARNEGRTLELTTLPAPDVPATVRAMLEQRLHRWHLTAVRSGEFLHDIQLCADELVTNACQATPSQKITFRATLAQHERAVTLSTWDASTALPTVRPVAQLAAEDIIPDFNALNPGFKDNQIGGWGLPMVVALSAAQGVVPTEPQGKWVWARLEY